MWLVCTWIYKTYSSSWQELGSPLRRLWCSRCCWLICSTRRMIWWCRWRRCLKAAPAGRRPEITSVTTTTEPSRMARPSTRGKADISWSVVDLAYIIMFFWVWCFFRQLPEKQHLQHLHRHGVCDQRDWQSPAGAVHRREEKGYCPSSHGLWRGRSRWVSRI